MVGQALVKEDTAYKKQIFEIDSKYVCFPARVSFFVYVHRHCQTYLESREPTEMNLYHCQKQRLINRNWPSTQLSNATSKCHQKDAGRQGTSEGGLRADDKVATLP